MGSKPFAQSTMDGSDQDGSPDINMKRRTVHGLYQPDKIVFLEWGGKSYLITADEGKTYSNPSAGLLDNARGASLVANDDLDVDADLLAELTDNAQLGRTFISTVDRISLSQKITKIHTFGGRGFSIFDADTLERQWESGDMIEKMSRWYYPDVFNSGYSAPNLTPTGERDSRSTLMGPELNSVAVANFQGRTVLIFGSGANGQIYVFQVQGSVKTQVDPEFQSVHRRGSTDGTWDNLQTRSEAGDIGIADLIVIDQVDSNIPGTPVLIVVSEVTGTVSTYTFADTQFGSCTAPTLRQQQPVSLNHHERKQPHV